MKAMIRYGLPIVLLISAPLFAQNEFIGIDLGDDGVTPNHTHSPTPGPNNFQNFPVLTSVVQTSNNTVIEGTLNSVVNSQFTIQFFSNPTNLREGVVLLGELLAFTDADGFASFTAVVPKIATDRFVTSTATRLVNSFPTDTSEFSAPLSVIQQPIVPNRCFKTVGTQRLCIPAPGLLAGIQAQPGCSLCARVVRKPLNGTVKIRPDGSFKYHANPNFTGVDTFTYQVVARCQCDDTQCSVPSNVATVFITVKPQRD